ncbi:hypothetical protein Pint_19024 [Pistacia integerrima]|uniref:Uncharacterized protein n=1 Tax=Pistacia integerrima TaxID=434235 RepID=A0ACC0YW54_9ROSI|nr:hypothetical protein Pint_19024 [Pistacia integerrima]
MALELSNRPFLLVVRPDITDKINDAYQKGFQDRIATRGHIVSWAPQQKVLAHPSIACFISHCGWNSTMEGISNGVPFLCWPYFGDQMHNENYICNIWRIGLGFNRDGSGIITSEEIKSKLQELLDNGKYKANALNLKERVMNSIKEDGSSYNNFNHFVEWLKAKMSTTLLDRTQFQELAMALELCNRPFLLVVRPDITDKINDAYQKGFQDRIATRGHIVSWAPQQKVLAHPSIACFISHCGWNSTMEGISNGVPFLCWPYFGDQMHNENYICNIWRIGLGLSKDESGIITREEIKTKLEELLDNSKYKANVLDLKERVLNSIKEGGSSYNNFKNFVEWLKA